MLRYRRGEQTQEIEEWEMVRRDILERNGWRLVAEETAPIEEKPAKPTKKRTNETTDRN